LKPDIVAQINKGLKIGKNGELIEWGKPFDALKDEAEIYNIGENGKPNLYFGKKEILPNITLGLYTPFDTEKSTYNDLTLNHLGQNLNPDDVNLLERNLISIFGEPVEKDDKFGFYRKWSIRNTAIEIIPRSHHGADWNAIIISNKRLLP